MLFSVGLGLELRGVLDFPVQELIIDVHREILCIRLTAQVPWCTPVSKWGQVFSGVLNLMQFHTIFAL